MPNVIPINPAAVAGDPTAPATAATAAANPDAWLGDMARDLAAETLETMRGEGGDDPEGDAACVLLLAATELLRDLSLSTHERAIGTMLKQAVGEMLDAYAGPIIEGSTDAAEALTVRIVPVEEARARLRAACFAAFRPDPELPAPDAA